MTTLVLLTPVGLDAGCWQWVRLPEMPAVRHEYPGHGRRPRHDPFPGLAALADEVTAAYPGPLHLAGVSMGAMVAMHCAIRHPSRVRSLLLACTNTAADGPAMLARARAAEAEGMASVIGPTLARWFTPAALGQWPEHPAVAYAAKALAGIGPAAFAGAWRAIARHDVRAELPSISVPVTCVAARLDAASPPDRVARIAGAVPGARMTMLDGPHMLHLERPFEFSAELSVHLDWACGTAS
jgi:pimeloyl-ACP methyl ester carboxylesterase